MGIIDEKQDMHEAAHDFYREEESRLEAEQEEREIEMLTLAEEWAYDAPWLPTSIEPPTYTNVFVTLTDGKDIWTHTTFFDGEKWYCKKCEKVTAWLPIPRQLRGK
jgi:hypothetical protein